MLTQIKIEAWADLAWEYLTRSPKSTFDQWAELKNFAPGDKIAIRLELQKPLGLKFPWLDAIEAEVQAEDSTKEAQEAIGEDK